MADKIKVRRDTLANWELFNPVLLSGELGYDETNKKIKIGDGVTAWQNLSYTQNDFIALIDGGGARAYTHSIYKTFNGILANKAIEIFSPAFNSGGVEILELNGITWPSVTSAGNYSNVFILANEVEPVSWNDGEIITRAKANDNTSVMGLFTLQNVVIPPNMGLYVISTRATHASDQLNNVHLLIKKR